MSHNGPVARQRARGRVLSREYKLPAQLHPFTQQIIASLSCNARPRSRAHGRRLSGRAARHRIGAACPQPSLRLPGKHLAGRSFPRPVRPGGKGVARIPCAGRRGPERGYRASALRPTEQVSFRGWAGPGLLTVFINDLGRWMESALVRAAHTELGGPRAPGRSTIQTGPGALWLPHAAACVAWVRGWGTVRAGKEKREEVLRGAKQASRRKARTTRSRS